MRFLGGGGSCLLSSLRCSGRRSGSSTTRGWKLVGAASANAATGAKLVDGSSAATTSARVVSAAAISTCVSGGRVGAGFRRTGGFCERPTGEPGGMPVLCAGLDYGDSLSADRQAAVCALPCGAVDRRLWRPQHSPVCAAVWSFWEPVLQFFLFRGVAFTAGVGGDAGGVAGADGLCLSGQAV
jgi:hypothetical protein